MDINKYIKQFIQNSTPYSLTKEDKQIIKHEGIKNYIFRKLSSSKYKATAIDAGYKQKVIDKIGLCVDHQIPIYITLPFGATKNPNLLTAPNIDWAEAFNIAYIRDYLKPIAKAYESGIVLDYISVAVFEEKVNYIPQKDTDLYDKQFQYLIKYFQSYLPNNMVLKYSHVSDLIPRNKIEELIEIKRSYLRKEWNKQSKETKENKLFRAERNCIIPKTAKNKEKLILEAALGHDAFCSEYWTSENAPWDKKYMITLGHRYTSGWAIHVRSTPGSTINFWSGTGLLLKKDKKLIPTVLSPIQFTKIKSNLKKEPIKLFNKEIKTLQNLQFYS